MHFVMINLADFIFANITYPGLQRTVSWIPESNLLVSYAVGKSLGYKGNCLKYFLTLIFVNYFFDFGELYFKSVMQFCGYKSRALHSK